MNLDFKQRCQCVWRIREVNLAMHDCLKPRVRVATICGFKAKWPMCWAYEGSASRNCMIA